MNIIEKFSELGIDNAPGQEGRQCCQGLEIIGEEITGISVPVDFSHGDVDAFLPIPGSLETFVQGVHMGGKQAYTEYRGKKSIREDLANKISAFTGAKIDFEKEIILTPGTQGALFLAVGANIMHGDKVAFVEPDYFANRKLVSFFDGILVPIQMEYTKYSDRAGIDLCALEEEFKSGVKLFMFSNPNNPTGVIYSYNEICIIAELGKKYGVTVIVDELYSRQIFDGHEYTHLCSQKVVPDNLITIIGPSKTESMSGYRLGVAFGNADIIERMEKLQAIMALRCGGYNQAVLKNWFNEPEGWMDERIAQHQSIRDDILEKLREVDGVEARTTEGGSYLFARLPELKISMHDFIKVLREKAEVTVTPGTEFGPQFVDWFRINFSQDHKAAVDAIERAIRVIGWYRK
jgi:aspartate/methionine/tyrosine aminotransferase